MSSSSSSSSPRLSQNARRDDHARMPMWLIIIAVLSARVRGAACVEKPAEDSSLPPRQKTFPCGTGRYKAYATCVPQSFGDSPSESSDARVGRPLPLFRRRELRLRFVPGHGERRRPVVWTVGLYGRGRLPTSDEHYATQTSPGYSGSETRPLSSRRDMAERRRKRCWVLSWRSC
jgi:hypothetical protein